MVRRGQTFFGAGVVFVLTAFVGVSRHQAAGRAGELRDLRAREAQIRTGMNEAADEWHAALDRWRDAGERGPVPAIRLPGAEAAELIQVQQRIIALGE